MPGRKRIWKGLGRNDEGGVAIVVACSAFLIVVLAALAVDVGSVVLRAREIQGTADLAALAAARDLSRASAASTATVHDNLGDRATVQTEVGVYAGDPTKAPDRRFVVTQASPNGARVKVSAPAKLYFAGVFGRNSMTVSRSATAAILGAEPTALFTVGSRLLSLDRGLVNSLLTGLLGSNVGLSVMDYNKLVAADVNLLEFMDALAVKLNVEAGDYDALLAHDVTTGQVLKVLEGVASADSRSVLSRLTGTPLNTKIKVGELVGVGADAREGLRRGLDVDVGALDLLVAALETGNDERQLALNTKINAVVADVTLMAGIGDKPTESAWVTLSSGGEPVLRTAQTRIYAKVETKKFVIELLRIDIELLAEVAAAEAKIADIQCGANNRVMVDARPGLVRVSLGEVENPNDLKNFKKEIRTQKNAIAYVLAIPITVFADFRSKDTRWQRLTFNQSDIAARTFKKVKSQEITSSLLKSVTDATKIEIGGLSLTWVLTLLTPLTTLLGWLLDAILNPLLSILGVGLGEADVAVFGMTCPGSRGGMPTLVG